MLLIHQRLLLNSQLQFLLNMQIPRLHLQSKIQTKMENILLFIIVLCAQIEIVVTFLVVKIFGFLVITRDHGSYEGRHQVEILPTDLPDLSKPKFQRSNRRTTNILDPKHFRTRKNNHDYLWSRLKGKDLPSGAPQNLLGHEL